MYRYIVACIGFSETDLAVLDMNSVQNTELYKSFASIQCLRVSCLADIDDPIDYF